MAEPGTIGLDSTLADLRLYGFQLDEQASGEELAAQLEAQPQLPGVIILSGGQLQGMVSRRRFLELLSRAYGRELFLRRSLATMCRFTRSEILLLSGSLGIAEGARRALERPVEQLGEPVVVAVGDTYQLLSAHDLLIAQSTVHSVTSHLLQEKIQAELRHTEKLASLGKLMAGIAHEIRNPVNFIGGNLSYLETYYRDLQGLLQAYQREHPPSPGLMELAEEVDLEFMLDDLPKILQSMGLGVERLQGLVSSLRTFSRMDDDAGCWFDLHRSLDGVLLMLNSQLKQGIQVQRRYGELPEVYCYPGQMGQVFMNLLSNAVDALEEHGCQPGSRDWQPQITIATARLDRLPEDAAPSQLADPWVSVRIVDNGPGIPAAIQAQVFQEFFTTKTAEKGTGLGLAIATQIIRDHHGQILLRSPCLPDGSGTEFEVLLPAAPQASATLKTPPAPLAFHEAPLENLAAAPSRYSG